MKFQCPHCKASYNLKTAGSYECISCHKSFYFQPKKDEGKITQKPQQTGPQTCPFCLSEVPSGAKKCAHCGEWISGNPPKSNTIYLLLSFLFGHFGIAEFYAERVFLGISYLVFTLLFLGISAKHPQAIIGVGAICIIQFLIALFIGPGNSSINTKTSKKKTNPFVLWISILFALAFIGISVWHLFFN